MKTGEKTPLILVCGSSSGGHVTPINAVVEQMKAKQRQDTRIILVGQRGDNYAKLIDSQLVKNKKMIFSGKFRWYHDEGLKQLLDIKTLLLNLRDAFLVVVGIVQAYMIIKKYRPAVIFSKGGSIGVPVGLAGAFLKIPIITHDSDATAGRSSRLISRWAVHHLVAMPKENYNYPSEDTQTVGIPVAEDFFSARKDQELLKELKLDPDKPVVLVLGGSQGAVKINSAIYSCLNDLLQFCQVIHIAGQTKQPAISQNEGYVRKDFIKPELMPAYSASSDLIITRAGATTMAEVSAVGRPMIVLPGKQLSGNHQTLNAKVFKQVNAALVLDEDDVIAEPHKLVSEVKKLLNDPEMAKQMVKSQARLIHRDSAKQIAEVILSTVKDSDVF